MITDARSLFLSFKLALEPLYLINGTDGIEASHLSPSIISTTGSGLLQPETDLSDYFFIPGESWPNERSS